MTKTPQNTAIAFALALGATTPAVGWAQDNFDIEALIAAAKTEPPITVYAVTGKIVDTAAAFSAVYGLQAEGRKVNEADQVELLIREHQAGNIMGDVSVAADVAAIAAQLLSAGIVESWVPGDLADHIDSAMRDPLVLVNDPHVWSYNTEAHAECPVKNIWELTEPQHARKVAMLDPLVKPNYADWFNQLEMHHDTAMAAAYEAHFGTPFDTSTGTATGAWVAAFAKNQPLLGDSDTVSSAIGAPGQADPFFGITSTAKYRSNESEGFKLGLCTDMQPFAGWLYPGPGMIAAGTDSPNAARLFIHFMLTEEGISNQTIDGKISTNTLVPVHANEPSGVGAHLERMMRFEMVSAVDDFDRRQDWQDHWRLNYSR